MAIKVNGELIAEEIIEQEMQRMRGDYEQVFAAMDADEKERQLREWAGENIIERVLISQRATQSGVEVGSEDIANVLETVGSQQNHNIEELDEKQKQQLIDDITERIRVEKFLDEICRDVVLACDDDAREYYEKNSEQFRSPEQVRAAHIVKHINWQCDEVAAMEAVQQAKSRIDSGELFENLVAEYSDCPDNGGDLGFITPGQMVEEFEDVVFKMSPGQTSGVFRTRFGYHIVKVYDRKGGEMTAFEDVAEQIKEHLNAEKRTKVIEDYVDSVKADSVIEKS